MGQILINDFAAGWCPSDDPVNGRKNGFVKMDCLELDRNGTLSLSGGIQQLGSPFTAAAHTIYSTFLSGTRTRYIALQEGGTSKVFRNNASTQIGSSIEIVSRAAFNAAGNFVIVCAGTVRLKDNGTTTTNLGLSTPSAAPGVAVGSAGVLTGTYDYVQIVVRNDGNGYIGKSAPSPLASVALTDQYAVVTPVNPVSVDAQANQVWIYRRGGDLDAYYRVYVQSTAAPFNDNISDRDILTLNQKLNERVVPTNATGIPENIIEIVGPIYGRQLYFTPSKVYFSEIDSPDSTDPNVALKVAGSTSELFLWARKMGPNVVLIGTTVDRYILTGTFVQLPDGFLDVSLFAVGAASPPISIDVAVTADASAEQFGSVVYMSNTGWVAASASGSETLLSDTRVDRLYRGTTVSGYGGVPIYLHPTLRYSCCISKGKLWVRIPQIVNNDPTLPFTYRMEVYDFKRQYWRPLPYSPSILFAEPDSNIMGFFPLANTLHDIDHPFTKLVNGQKQSIDLITMYFDDGTPSNNKDALSLKIKANTGNDPVTVVAFTDGLNSTNLGSFTSNFLADSYINVKGIIPQFKNIEFRLTGQSSNFILNEIVLEYFLHPPSVLGYQSEVNYGPNKKRGRVWPVVIDPLGGQVTFTPIVDGIAQVSTMFTGTGKRTYYHHFFTDVFGVDYQCMMESITPFEVWEVASPEFVQILPIAKQYDQIGPIEVFRYGKIKAIEFRVIPFGGTLIPYTVYFEDNVITTDTINAVDGKETVQKIDATKTVGGTILRVEIGPVNFDFHIIDARVLVARSGNKSDEEWMPLSKINGQ